MLNIDKYVRVFANKLGNAGKEQNGRLDMRQRAKYRDGTHRVALALEPFTDDSICVRCDQFLISNQ